MFVKFGNLKDALAYFIRERAFIARGVIGGYSKEIGGVHRKSVSLIAQGSCRNGGDGGSISSRSGGSVNFISRQIAFCVCIPVQCGRGSRCWRHVACDTSSSSFYSIFVYRRHPAIVVHSIL